MDDHEVKFYERVRTGYLELVKQEPQRWVIVNSDQKWDDVQAELKKVVVEKLSK
jgi:thymidylate kinase